MLSTGVLSSCSSGGGKGGSGQLGAVQSNKELRIAISAFAPQDFQKPDGSWTGYDVDILNGFAATLGAKLKVDSMNFDASIQSVSSRRDDITVDIYYSKDRAKVLAYSRPMLNYNDVVAVRASGPKASSAADLAGKTVGILSGNAINSYEIARTKGAKSVKFSEFSDLLLALKQGRVDAIYATNTNISTAAKDPKNDIKYLGPVPAQVAPPIESLRGYFGLPKGSFSAQLLTKLNAYLKKIGCDGTEQHILDTYGLTQPVYLQGICAASDTYTGK